MTEPLFLRIPPNHDELEQIPAAVEEFAERDNWPPDLVFKLNLVLEELGVNIVNYSGATGAIEISLASDEETVTIEIADNGRPFNPLAELDTPDISAPLGERPVGGLGVHLVRSMMDELSYSREDGMNRLAMTKRKAG
ncbi:MAG: ATP-binding protein [Dehalococcoidia bacterium]|nr:ATP-binding protein [Dehalococcoidia bacterium]